MPNRYVVLEEGRLVVELWWGEVHSEEIVQHEKEQLCDPRVAPGAVALADLRRASFPGREPLDVEGIAATHGSAANETRFSRYALLSDHTETFLRSRAFEKEMEPFGVRVVVFVALSTACTWLGCDPVQVESVIEELLE